MQITLVRHATLLVDFADHRLLVDPMLSEAGAMDPVPNAADDRRIPLVDLPLPAPDLLAGVDAILLTHLHRDHFDAAAVSLLPKHLPVLCQPGDADRLRELSFAAVRPVSGAVEYAGVEFIRTDGKHGTGLIGQKMGTVSGFVLRATGEPVLYIAGDTVWCGHVREALEVFRPDVVVVNAGAAQFLTGSPITMDVRDVARVCQAEPEAAVVAVHMGAVNHCLLTREALQAGLGSDIQVQIPADGETLRFPGAPKPSLGVSHRE